MKCDECGKKLNRHGDGHTEECETGIKTQKALQELKDRLHAELEKSVMPKPKFRMPKGE
jgi:hypothetical protein